MYVTDLSLFLFYEREPGDTPKPFVTGFSINPGTSGLSGLLKVRLFMLGGPMKSGTEFNSAEKSSQYTLHDSHHLLLAYSTANSF